MRRSRRAKIIATLGPSSSDAQTIRALFDAGVDVFRLNSSHGTHADRAGRVDVLREMERDGLFGKLHEEFLSTTGNVNPLENSRRMGREMVEWLKIAQVDGVILVST